MMPRAAKLALFAAALALALGAAAATQVDAQVLAAASPVAGQPLPPTACGCCGDSAAAKAEREAGTCSVANIALHRPFGSKGSAHLEVVDAKGEGLPELGNTAAQVLPAHRKVAAEHHPEGVHEGHDAAPTSGEADPHPDVHDTLEGRMHGEVVAGGEEQLHGWGVRAVAPDHSEGCSAVIPGESIFFTVHHVHGGETGEHHPVSHGGCMMRLHTDTLLPLFQELEERGYVDEKGHYISDAEDHAAQHAHAKERRGYTLIPAVHMSPEQEAALHMAHRAVDEHGHKVYPYHRIPHPNHEEPERGPEGAEAGILPEHQQEDPWVDPDQPLGMHPGAIRIWKDSVHGARRLVAQHRSGILHDDVMPDSHADSDVPGHDPFHSLIDWDTDAFHNTYDYWNEAIAAMSSRLVETGVEHLAVPGHREHHSKIPVGGVLPLTSHRFPERPDHVAGEDDSVCFDKVQFGLKPAPINDAAFIRRYVEFMRTRLGYNREEHRPGRFEVCLWERMMDGRITNLDELREGLQAINVWPMGMTPLGGGGFSEIMRTSAHCSVIMAVTGEELAASIYRHPGAVAIQIVPYDISEAEERIDHGDAEQRPLAPDQDPAAYAALLRASGPYLEYREGHTEKQRLEHGEFEYIPAHSGAEFLPSHTPDVIVDVNQIVELVKKAQTMGMNPDLLESEKDL